METISQLLRENQPIVGLSNILTNCQGAADLRYHNLHVISQQYFDV